MSIRKKHFIRGFLLISASALFGSTPAWGQGLEKTSAPEYQYATDLPSSIEGTANVSSPDEAGDVRLMDDGRNSFVSDTLAYSWNSNDYSYKMRDGYPEISKSDTQGTWTFAILDYTEGMPENLALYTIDKAKEYYQEKDPAFPEGVFMAMEQKKPAGFDVCNGVSTGVYYIKDDTGGTFSHIYGISGSEHTFVLALTFTGSKGATQDIYDLHYIIENDAIEKEMADILDSLRFAKEEEYQNIEHVNVFGSVG